MIESAVFFNHGSNGFKFEKVQRRAIENAENIFRREWSVFLIVVGNIDISALLDLRFAYDQNPAGGIISADQYGTAVLLHADLETVGTSQAEDK